ncbi:MAG: hypothetical protein H6618_08110 [Deltaproteobacteria bacterium]|nr:hypothetical protein [Deltaproteobacteria bacterium]
MQLSGTGKKDHLVLRKSSVRYVLTVVGLIVCCSLSFWWGGSNQAPEAGTVLLTENLRNFPHAVCQKLWKVDFADSPQWSFNSGNREKQQEFQVLFRKFGLETTAFTNLDIREIEASHDQVVIHKASSIEQDWVLVEDSALDVAGENIGINIRWNLHRLPEWIGRRAVYTAKLAHKVGEVVYVYTGVVSGRIVEPRGDVRPGAEFDPYFLPDQSDKTLAEGADDTFSPRAIAMKKLVRGQVDACSRLITVWDGAWQNEQK